LVHWFVKRLAFRAAVQQVDFRFYLFDRLQMRHQNCRRVANLDTQMPDRRFLLFQPIGDFGKAFIWFVVAVSILVCSTPHVID
jgi:hypothetical protein